MASHNRNYHHSSRYVQSVDLLQQYRLGHHHRHLERILSGLLLHTSMALGRLLRQMTLHASQRAAVFAARQ